MYEPQTMIAQLMATMDQINDQIQEVNAFAAANNIPVSTVQHQDGRWVMAELALGKAQVLHAMVLMEEQINREVARKRNEEIYKEEIKRSEEILREYVYVYDGRSVRKVGTYSQDDQEWLQRAVELNPRHIYFYAKDN